MTTRKIFICLPAYNEEDNLEPLFAAWCDVIRRLDAPHQFVVVDDGSSDQTPAILDRLAERLPLAIHTHQPNQGLGPTIRDALYHAAQIASPDDVLVTMDADNTHPPELFETMLERLDGNGCDVMIASRYAPGGQVVGLGAFRSLMSWGARILFAMVYPIHGVRDYTCGYRTYRAEVIQRGFACWGRGFIDQQGFQAMADILLRLAKLGVTFDEVGMVLRYDRKGGVSKMRVGPTVLATLRLLLRRRLERQPTNDQALLQMPSRSVSD